MRGQGVHSGSDCRSPRRDDRVWTRVVGERWEVVGYKYINICNIFKYIGKVESL